MIPSWSGGVSQNMAGMSAHAERDVYSVNLGYDDAGGEEYLEDSNDSKDGDAAHSDTAQDFISFSRGLRSGNSWSGNNFEKLTPVRLASCGDISHRGADSASLSVGSGRVETRVTAKSPAWCDRLSSSGAKAPGMSARTRSPNSVVRRSSAPGSATAPPRVPMSSPRSSMTSQANDSSMMGSVKGDVALYARLRPGNSDEVCAVTDGLNGIRLRQLAALRADASEAVYRCDRTFGPDASQEDVYQQAVTPIVEAVISGYNGAVIAYGQTGSGKTHTMIGGARCKGIAPRAVAEIFNALEKRANWTVEVSVLEIYNERVRDLLGSGQAIKHVDVHENIASDQNISFRCPDATKWKCLKPEDALAALTEGMKRRETARTDMNHASSRSHLIFTICTSQSEHDIGATLHGRLHVVDLAGSERLKRSMSSEKSFRAPSNGPRTPRDQRREAGEINKSLSQLALVIQRLTGPSHSSLQYVPYRDSMLTRLLAESFGGSSKTCLIITCSALAKDREETRCTLEFGKRAKLVKNKAEINIEVTHEPTPIMQAWVQKELQELQQRQQAMVQDREVLIADRTALKQRLGAVQDVMKDAANDAVQQQTQRIEEARRHEDEKSALQDRNAQTLSYAKEAQVELAEEVANLQNSRIMLHGRLVESASEIARLKQENVGLQERWLEDISRLEAEKTALAERAEQEKETLRKQLAEAMAFQDVQTKIRLGVASNVQEAAAAAQQAELEGTTIAAKSSERLAGLRKQLEVALTETAESDQLRKDRLTDLEFESMALTQKWQLAVENLTGSASKAQEPTSPCLPSRSEIVEAVELPISGAAGDDLHAYAAAADDMLLQLHSPNASQRISQDADASAQQYLLSSTGAVLRGSPWESASSAEPFSNLKMATLDM